MTFRLYACSMVAVILAVIGNNTETLAQERSGALPILSIIGKGRVTATPDIVYVSSGVVSEAETAKEALAKNSVIMEHLITALTEMGIERRHIQTSNFSVNPRYHYHNANQRPPKIVGYTVQNTVSVKVEKLSQLGDTLSKLVSLGSNQLGNIRFDLSNREALRDEARRLAVANARRKAELYAEAAGVTLGDIVSLSEAAGAVSHPRPQFAARAEALSADAVRVPVAAGEDEVRASVHIIWNIKD